MTERMPDFQVRDSIWRQDMVITDIKQHRHRVMLPLHNTPSTVTFCNNCGSAVVVADKCAECGEAA